MTRQDFIERVNNWSGLLDFCRDEDCDICEDIYSEDDMDEYINDNLRYLAGDCSWWDLRDILNDIPTDAEYYYKESDTEWKDLYDEDFEDYKERVLQWMDEGEYWDDDDEEYFEEENPPLDDEEENFENLIPIEDEDISALELLTACNKELHSIKDIIEEENESENEEFSDFIALITVKEER